MSHEYAQEWIGRLCPKVAKCNYRDPDRLLKEQFIVRLNLDGMTDEILREVIAPKNIEEATSEHVLG